MPSIAPVSTKLGAFKLQCFSPKASGLEAFAVIFWAQFSKGQCGVATVLDNCASTDRFKWAAKIDSHLIVSVLLARLQHGYEKLGTGKQF